MKKIQLFLFLLAFGLFGYSASLHAEDVDIYVANSNTVGTPNVLIVLYNGADADADAGASCTYSDGSTPSTGGSKVISLVQCSLVEAIAGLTDGSVNLGIAVNNATGLASTQATTDKTKGGYHDLCAAGGDGGCIVRKVTTMNTAGKQSLTAFIKGLTAFNGGGTDANGMNLKVNAASADPAVAMQEAWAYYNGKTGLSGTNYGTSILAGGCQRNFVIYIGTSAKSVSTSGGTAGITAGQVGATAAQLNPITGTVKFNPSICGKSTYALASGNDWADEWTRLMYQQDGGASGNSNTQNIITYAINVEATANKCFEDSPGMFSSMAKMGGGKFYNATSAVDLSSTLNSILNEVQAVNSVFSAASLPVSVNAQGTYLNQIYLGMFRPDSTASPRWLGNLKQYKLIKDTTGSLVLGDALGQSAIVASGTGFITPTAVSYWTNKDTTKAPDNISNTGGFGTFSGFFSNNPEGTPVSGYDLPDGEVVEKGGAAQMMRTENLTATFAGSGNTASTNPRRLYTYCPSGSGCNTDLTHSSNDFSTANSGIASSAFGTTTTIKVTNIARTGTSAVVTTNTNHGFSDGTSITLAGTTYYDGTYTISSASGKVFTIPTGDYPNNPSQNSYTISSIGASSVSVTAATRTPNASSVADTESVTYTTAPNTFTTTSPVQITGVSPSDYSFTATPSSVTSTSVTFNNAVTITPRATPLNTYTAAFATSVPATLNTDSGGGNLVNSSFTGDINLRVGQSVTITGSPNSKYNDTFTIATASYNSTTNTTSFTATGGSNALKNQSGSTGTLSLSATTKPITTLKRTGTTDASIATATGLPSGWFGTVANQTATVAIAKATGTKTDETAYEKTSVVATCQNAGCTTITYPITVSPSSVTTFSSAKAGPPGSATVTVAAGKITRNGSTATVDLTGSGATSTTFTSGQQVQIAQTGTLNSTNESAYQNVWTISCAGSCLTFTLTTAVPLTPPSSQSGSSMTAYSATTAPDRDTVIKWVRGLDNYGDELGPGGSVTVRPSIHGDVLHSRPLVINYGDSRGIVVYYGSNDGVFHAVNGDQTGTRSGVAAGNEMWGFILPEHFGYLNRQRTGSPELKFPTTALGTATAKDYFVDGPTGSYQKLNSDGTVNKAYIFLTMRRGGRFVYALDVTTPTAPKFLWKIDATTTGFTELGQTWSRPRLTLLQAPGLTTTPVLVFGGGYDSAEDNEPPTTDSMGRGLYVVNAITGALIWSATPGCTTSATCVQTTGMTHAIPSEVTFVDRDSDGLTDKIYVGDVGGNIWRADVSAAATSSWTMTKVAALGCDAGVCPSGTTPRKFFFPPAVLSVKAPGVTGSYDVLALESGDREHPLKNTATGSAYNVVDRFFMIKDQTTTVTPSTFLTANVTQSGLFNATSTAWDGTSNGFYITFATGEKGVNQPLALNGNIFFSTNQPKDPSATCVDNLGTARAYAVSPFTSEAVSNVLAGGGLPPSPVAGLVEVTTGTGASAVTTEEKFCIGCGVPKPPGNNATGPTTCTGNAALQNCTPLTNVTGSIKRTYWYKK